MTISTMTARLVFFTVASFEVFRIFALKAKIPSFLGDSVGGRADGFQIKFSYTYQGPLGVTTVSPMATILPNALKFQKNLEEQFRDFPNKNVDNTILV